MTVSLLDMAGKLVLPTPIDAVQGFNKRHLELPSLNNGLYYLMLQDGDQQIDLKLMVVK